MIELKVYWNTFLFLDRLVFVKRIPKWIQQERQGAFAALVEPLEAAPATCSAAEEDTRWSGSRASNLATVPSTGAVESTARNVMTTNGLPYANNCLYL